MLIITGPNTGGKTVALKTVGLLVLMALAGLKVPADEGSAVTVFRSVHADIGDEQSIEQSLSTFSSHVSHIVEMLREVDDHGLVLLDELGAGTDPREGSALARALLEHLRQRRVFCIATTHYSELKLYAHAAPRVENASVEFDPATLSPTYRLQVGLPGRSNALEIAGRLGVPRVILERARAALDPTQLEAGQLLDEIQSERQAAREARLLAEREREAAARDRARLEQALAAQQREQQKVWQQAEDASRQTLAEFRRQVDALRAELERTRVDSAAVERLASRAAALAPVTAPPAVRRRAARAVAPPVPTEPPRPLAIGAEVVVPSLGVPGRITRLESDEAEVDVRGMRVRLRTSELANAQPVVSRGSGSPGSDLSTRIVLKERGHEVPLQLDLRGQRRDEAADELDRYLNEAYLSGLKSVRVVHGKGTGAVRRAVHELLTSHPLVRRFTVAPREASGEGATEEELVIS
jgi:DNA mismatch repair protein MutS2